MQNLTEQILKSQAESDKKFIELEEMRLKHEQRERDREERMKREEREFQKIVFSMLCTPTMPMTHPNGYVPWNTQFGSGQYTDTEDS